MTASTTAGRHVLRVAADERPELVATPAAASLNNGGLILVGEATPTQVANPKRTTARAALQLALAVFTALPIIIPIVLEAWSPGWLVAALAQVLLVQTVIVRVMAVAGVNAWLTEHLPSLAAIPSKQVAAR